MTPAQRAELRAVAERAVQNDGDQLLPSPALMRFWKVATPPGILTLLDDLDAAERALAALKAERVALRDALNTIAYLPIGDAEDSDGRVYDNIVAIARHALAERDARGTPR